MRRESMSVVVLRSAFVAAVMAGCGGCGGSSGDLTVAAWGEGYAEEGIAAADVSDGWTIDFERVLVGIGEVEVRPGTQAADATARLDGWRVVDVTQPTAGAGQPLLTEEVPAGRYADVRWRIASPPEGVERMGLPARASFFVEGRAERGGQVKTFAWTFDRDTRYLDCASVAEVAPDGEARALLTLHLDHLFFDHLFDETPDIAFDLIASADDNGNADGEVTREELLAVDLRTQARYGVGGTGITDLWHFIEYQVTQVGHIDGEGHCRVEPGQ